MVTTINAYSVGLTLDASSYVNGSKLARSETNALIRDITAAKTPGEIFASTYDRLERALSKGAITLDTYSRLLDAARQKQAAATPAIKSTSQAFAEQNKEIARSNQLFREQSSINVSAGANRIASANGTIGSSLVALGTRFAGPIALLAGLKGSITSSFETGRAVASLEVLTGSAQNAANMMTQLREIDAKSPLTMEASLQASRTLMSFGVSVDEVIPRLRQLGDVTGADNERFKSMALAFAQVSAAGRLQGQDLRQMIDAGFNPLQEISRKTGESLVTLKERMEAGGISSREIAEAFDSVTAKGGKFEGMMDKLGNTAAGKWGQAMSKIKQIGIQIGDGLAPLVANIADLIIEWAPLLDPVLWILKKLGQGLGFIVALVNDVTHVFKKFGAMASGEVVTLNEMFAMPNTSKMLDGLNAATSSASSLATQVTKVTAATNSAASAAERYKNTLAIIEKQRQTTEENALAFDAKLLEMEKFVRQGGEDKRNIEEMDAIKQLFDLTNTSQRASAGLFNHLVDTGKEYEKHLGNILNADQMEKLNRFRAIQSQTKEIERQEKLKDAGEKRRKELYAAAQKIIEKADPMQKLVSDIADVQRLVQAGALSEKFGKAEEKRLAGEFAKSNPNQGRITQPTSIEVGSQEAYKFITGMQTDKANEQLREMQAQRVLLEAQNKLLATVADNSAPIRVRR
jgi:tape measure domain-containing protein